MEIDGAPMARQAGKLAWSHVRPPAELRANLSASAWLAKATAPWARQVSVTRFVCAIPDVGLWIVDRIHSRTPRRATLYWHVPAYDWRASTTNPKSHQFSSPKLHVGIQSHHPCEAVIDEAGKDSPTGWRSRGYGTLERAARIQVSLAPASDMFIVTYVGRHLCPFEVYDGTHYCAGGGFESMHGENQQESGDFEICWNIQGPEGKTFHIGAGGAPSANNGHEWEVLRGKGNWPAAIIRTGH